MNNIAIMISKIGNRLTKIESLTFSNGYSLSKSMLLGSVWFSVNFAKLCCKS